MVKPTNKELQLQIKGYGLTTAVSLYHLANYPSLIQLSSGKSIILPRISRN